MVRGHRGALGVASTPGVGSTFRLMLPAAGGSAVPFAPAQEVEASSWQHRGRVLVVDDESAVRSTTADMLRSFGLDPLEAGDGAEALEIFRQQQGGIELVVLNLLMPVMNGEQTLVALRAIEPGVRVLLVSGQGEGDIVQRRGPDGPLRFLGKPFTRAALEKELRELLGET